MPAVISNTGARTKLLLVVLALSWSSGCLSSVSMITAVAPEGNAATLSRVESSRLVDAIQVQLQKTAGAVFPLSGLEELRTASASQSDYTYLVVAAFSVGSTKSLPLSKVYVLENKRDRTTAVIVDNQGGWPLSVPFTNSVIRAVKLAFADVLPSHDAIVEQRAGVDLR